MKNILILVAILLSSSMNGQEVKSVTNPSKLEITCDLVRYDTETKVIEFIGNVSFKTEIIEIEKADKIIFDQASQEIIATGLGQFLFDGVIQVANKGEKKILKYKIGEKIAYVE